MTQPHDDDSRRRQDEDAQDQHGDQQGSRRKGRHSHQEPSESQSLEHGTLPETDQADDEVVTDEAGEEPRAGSGVGPVGDSPDNATSQDQGHDQQPESGGDAPEQDSVEVEADHDESAGSDGDDTAEASDSAGSADVPEATDAGDSAEADDSDAEAASRSETDASSRRRRTRAGRRSRTVGQSIVRGIGILTSVALAGAVGGVTWWGYTAPRTPTPQLEALRLTEPRAATTYVCPHAPTNTLRGTDVGAVESTTTIVPADGAESIQSATYAGKSIPVDAATSMNAAEGGILSLAPTGGRVANAVGSVATVTKSGDLRGLTTAPCAQPGAMSWIVGGSIAAGSSAELRLTNPGATPATVKVNLYGSIGRLSLPSNGEVTVPAGGSSSLVLETKGSQDPRIAVSIEADGGSVVPTLVTESLDGETPAGTDVITPGAAPATDLVVPGVEIVEPATQGEVPDAKTSADSSDTPAVRIVNPGQAPATVSVTMLGKDGAHPLAGAQSVTIDAGSVFDIQLAGVAAGTYGVQVTSSAPVGAAVRMVRSGGEYPARSKALVHDQAWAQAALPGAADSGLLAVPRAASLTSSVTVANSGPATSLTLSSLDGSWSQDVTVAKGSAVVVEVPAKVAAVRLSAAGSSSGQSRTPSGLAAATVVTAQAGGQLAGTLISTVSAQPDAAAQAQRRILLG
ncbi:DUF5719 family protein [Actinomyces naeslundii]|uniref:DUF5719 family protein n=1 Tax=Actinomyces naeslundii TaxID=1655 RepID=UPI00096D8F35|nr:DUF5719 family protein [Actinomyces naeslundii]OMG16757.1 hypothetical protein BKH04_07305 [Actinomyces naeslundii]PKY95580.1 hypothetical protein CYJ18_06805 [Actinomyces naeslundii]